MRNYTQSDIDDIVLFEDSVWTLLQTESFEMKKQLEKYNLDVILEKVYIPLNGGELSDVRLLEKDYFCQIEIVVYDKNYPLSIVENSNKSLTYSRVSNVVRYKKGKYNILKNDMNEFLEYVYSDFRRLANAEIDKFFVVKDEDTILIKSIKRSKYIVRFVKIFLPIILILLISSIIIITTTAI